MAHESCNLDKEEAEILKPSSPSSTPAPQSPSTTPPSVFLNPQTEIPIQRTAAVVVAVAAVEKAEEGSQPAVRFGNRCSSCKKRVGLTGFRCRCGDLFCSQHRYSDIHDCSFDYKAAGREEIAKANPVIRAAKIIKI